MREACKVVSVFGPDSRLVEANLDLGGCKNMAVGVFSRDTGKEPCARAAAAGYANVISVGTEETLDYLGQALLLQAAIQEFSPDLIVCDGTIPSQAVAGALAFLLGRVCVSGVLEAKAITSLQECEVLRRGDHGITEFRCPMPCILSLSPQARLVPVEGLGYVEAIRHISTDTLLAPGLVKKRIATQPTLSHKACELFSDAGALALRLRRGC